jgi:hypothetical protein
MKSRQELEVPRKVFLSGSTLKIIRRLQESNPIPRTFLCNADPHIADSQKWHFWSFKKSSNKSARRSLQSSFCMEPEHNKNGLCRKGRQYPTATSKTAGINWPRHQQAHMKLEVNHPSQRSGSEIFHTGPDPAGNHLPVPYGFIRILILTR